MLSINSKSRPNIIEVINTPILKKSVIQYILNIQSGNIQKSS